MEYEDMMDYTFSLEETEDTEEIDETEETEDTEIIDDNEETEDTEIIDQNEDIEIIDQIEENEEIDQIEENEDPYLNNILEKYIKILREEHKDGESANSNDLDCNSTDSEYNDTDLILRELDITGDEKLFKHLMELMCTNSTVEFIDLDENKLVYLTDIAKMLRVNKNLRDLHLSSNKINLDGIINLVDSLCVNTTLRRLDIGCGDFADLHNDNTSTILQLSKLVKKNKGLKTLNIRDCYINDHGIVSVFEALKKNSSLKTLYLENNVVICDFNIFENLEKNSTLRNLHMNSVSDNSTLSTKMTMQLSLSSKINIRMLNLRHNLIDDNGAKNIAEFLMHNDSLKILVLSCNIIGHGSVHIFNSLKTNRRLTDLNLSHNVITSEDSIEFAKSIPDINLKKLNLSSNYIDTVGGIKIAEALCLNNSLQEIDIYPGEFYKIEPILQSNYTLTDIKSSDTNIKIVEIVDRNKQILQNRRFVRTKRASQDI